MSAPIHSQLADELNLPDEKAEKLLGAMLREVRKRALRQGVRLPDFGKFKEEDGRLAFEPSKSLARAVNHRFEGLDSEDLGSAPDTPTKEDSDSNEGPDTITLGYQDSDNWSPIDAEDETTDSTNAEEPDTAEFEVPSADEAADTEEIQAAEDTAEEPTDQHTDAPESEESPPAPSSPGSSRTETEELYPLVEDMPAEKEEDASDSAPPSDEAEQNEEFDRERDTLSDIWGSKAEDSKGAPPSSSEPEVDSPSESPTQETDLFGDADESDEGPATDAISQDSFGEPDASSTEPEPEEREPEQNDPDVPDEGPRPPEEPTPEPAAEEKAPEPVKEKSTTLRVLTTLLILVLVGGGAWYILGQRGIVPSPRTTYAQLRAQIGPQGQSSPGASASTASTTGSSTTEQDSAVAGGASTTSTGESSTQSSTTGAEQAPSSDPDAPTDAGSSSTIDPSAGGWTIVVASRTQDSGAQSVASDFRQRFSDQQVPTGVLSGNVENTTRYRVAVGQFDSRASAQQFLDEFGSELPDGAWPLRLQ